MSRLNPIGTVIADRNRNPAGTLERSAKKTLKLRHFPRFYDY